MSDSPGPLDVLVNNAAAFVDWTETATGADLQRAREVLETNLFGTWSFTQALLPLLQQSQAAHRQRQQPCRLPRGPRPRPSRPRRRCRELRHQQGPALNALTSTLAAELAGTGVLVNAVYPGLTATWPARRGHVRLACGGQRRGHRLGGDPARCHRCPPPGRRAPGGSQSCR